MTVLENTQSKLTMNCKTTFLLGLSLVQASILPQLLKDLSSTYFPILKNIALDVYDHPEVGLSEHHAHDLVVNHFTKEGIWDVTPHAYGLNTAWALAYEHRPAGTPSDAALPAIGFLAEYDALVGIGHACGHHLILLNGLLSATLARETIRKLDIPARIIVHGTPDEENTAGKYAMLQAGAFDDAEVWLMAHPTSADAIQPMNARLNAVHRFSGTQHAYVVRKAYQAMVSIRDLAAAGLPGTASSVAIVEDVGMFASNIVQTKIELGVAGLSTDEVKNVVSSVLDTSYPNVTFSLAEDPEGVAITALGPGGHASENTKSPLVLTIEVFRVLSSNDGVSFYLPGNTTAKALDITVDFRTRYAHDLDSLAQTVTSISGQNATSITTDLPYPALEVTPVLPQLWVDLLKTPDYGSQDWPISTFAPASTDASWIQGAEVDPVTKELLRAERVVLHANFGICQTGGICAFNHEPLFAQVAATNYAYNRTEIVARAMAHMAVELLTDGDIYKKVTAIIGNDS